MANSYSALGRWFEYLNDDCDYGQWSQYLIDLVKTRASGLSGLDIGCGNGYFTRAFIKEGFSVRGVDISPQMLDTAKTLALKEGVKAEFLLGDITKLTINGKVDFCIAVNDCINYVPKDKLTKAFSHVYNCLKKGGASSSISALRKSLKPWSGTTSLRRTGTIFRICGSIPSRATRLLWI